jgi:hypothetical protein
MNFSSTYETGIQSFEKESLEESPAVNRLPREEAIIKGVRQGIKKAGMSSSSIRLIDNNSVDNHDGTINAGAFNPANGEIALASPEHISKTVDLSVSNIQEKVGEQIESTLTHEQRHKISCENAKARGESGLIAAHLGQEANRLLQELMASKGTEKFDAYDADRARAIQLASQLNLSAQEVIQMVFEGREADVVLAAFTSGYLKPKNVDLN